MVIRAYGRGVIPLEVSSTEIRCGVSMSDWEDFKLGFWHPFGPHGGELSKEILPRKKRETEKNGWTLWSFNYTELEVWHGELTATDPPSVFAFCSNSKNSSDPGGAGTKNKTRCCTQFKFVGPDEHWQPVPDAIKIPHPFKPGEHKASAFVVERVEFPIQSFSPVPVEWFSRRNRRWNQGVVIGRGARRGTTLPWPNPSRPELLIRPGGAYPMREVSAVLKLKEPYLAYVRIDDG
jgi:hypothetical protein